MATDNPNEAQHATQEHEKLMQQVTEQYIDAYTRGQAPSVEEYARRYPELAEDLLEFALFFHAYAEDTDFSFAPEPYLDPAASAALQQIHAMEEAKETPVPRAAAARAAHFSPDQVSSLAPVGGEVRPIKGILAEAAARKLSTRKLAAMVDVTSEVLAKLDARAIEVTSIPSAFLRRLAENLNVPAGSIHAYLSGIGGPATSAQFYFAESAPEQKQESFLQAIDESALTEREKRHWREVAESEGLA